jgi:hypothetical protein
MLTGSANPSTMAWPPQLIDASVPSLVLAAGLRHVLKLLPTLIVVSSNVLALTGRTRMIAINANGPTKMLLMFSSEVGHTVG